jgi:hypothetical protein
LEDSTAFCIRTAAFQINEKLVSSLVPVVTEVTYGARRHEPFSQLAYEDEVSAFSANVQRGVWDAHVNSKKSQSATPQFNGSVTHIPTV